MPDINEKLVKDLYKKYAPNEVVSSDRLKAIENKYGADYKTLITDFYSKYAPKEQMNDVRYQAVVDRYGLDKKKELPESIQPDPEIPQELQPTSSIPQPPNSGNGSIAQLDEQPLNVPEGDLGKERNPAVSFGKKAWETLSYQLPASAAATAATGLGSAKDLTRIAEGGSKEIYNTLNNDNIYSREAKGEVEKILKTNERLSQGVKSGEIPEQEYQDFLAKADERIKFLNDQGFIKGVKDGKVEKAQKELVQWATERQAKGAEFSEDLVDTMDEIKDPIDFLNWTASALGQGAAQILPTLATAGATSLSQEIGGIYLDQIQEIANKKGIKPVEVIERGLDDKASSVSFGVVAGLLDRVGAGKVLTSFGKKEFTNSVRQRALTYLTGATIPEAVTEGAQTILEQIGAGKDLDWKEVREAMAQGAVAGTGMSVVGGEVSNLKSKQNDQTKTETPKAENIASPESGDTEQSSPVAEDTPQLTKENKKSDQSGSGIKSGENAAVEGQPTTGKSLETEGDLGVNDTQSGIKVPDVQKEGSKVVSQKDFEKEATDYLSEEYVDKDKKSWKVASVQMKGEGKGVDLIVAQGKNEKKVSLSRDEFFDLVDNKREDRLQLFKKDKSTPEEDSKVTITPETKTEVTDTPVQVTESKQSNEATPDKPVEKVSVKPDKITSSNQLITELDEKVLGNPKKLSDIVNFYKTSQYKNDDYSQKVVNEALPILEKRLKQLKNTPQDLNEKPSGKQNDSVHPERATIIYHDGIQREGEVVSRKNGKITIKNAKGEPYTVPVGQEIKNGSRVDGKTLDSGSKIYESIDKKTKSGRTPVSPITGKSPKKLNEITLNLSKGLGSKIFYTKKPSERHSLGSYRPGNAAIAIKYTGDLDTTAHELGHSLDDKFGLLTKAPESVKSELTVFAEFGSKPPKGHLNPESYLQGEGVAEWVRAYIVNPAQATKAAPEFAKWYKESVPEDVQKKIIEFSDDVRTFAGATGHDAIMSNVQWEPSKQKGSLLETLRPSSISNDGFSLSWMDKIGVNFTNSMLPYEKAIDYLKGQKGINEILPANDPKLMARVFLGANEKFDNIMNEGLVDGKLKRVKDEVTGEPITFKWLLTPLDNTSEKSIKQETQEMASYMIAERTKELKGRFGKEVLTGIGAGIYKDADVATKRIEEHNNLPKEKRVRIEEAARRYRVYTDNILKYMVEKNRMSPTDYKVIKDNNIHYVALQRVMEAAPDEDIQVFTKQSSKSIGSSKEVIKKIKGSSKMIKNPYGSLIETSYKAIQESDRNEVMLSFKELFTVDRDMSEGEVRNLAEIARPAAAGDKNTIKVFNGGDPEYWQLQPDVYAAVKNINSVGANIPRFITALPRLVRWTVTNFPVFAARNRVRDFQNRMVISKTNPESGFDLYTKKGIKSEMTELYQLFGGGQAGYYMLNDKFYQEQMEISMKELVKDNKTILANPKKLVDSYRRMISSSETAGRLEEFRSAFKNGKKKGLDDYNASLYAAFESRDLMDFAVAGNVMREVNKLIPFSNAAVQGLRKNIKVARGNPKEFALRMLVYSAAPALLNRVLIGLMDKDDEYQELPSYQRDLFYNIPIGDTWLAIPKPFEVGVIGSGFDRLLDKMYYGNDSAFDGYAGSVARTTLPVDESAIAGPFKSGVEVLANYDFFRQKNIIPPSEEKKDLAIRNTQWGSRLGQTLQKVVGVDARQIDHIIKANATYFGDMALSLSDIGRDDSKNSFDLTDLGFFKRSPVYTAKSVQWVMEKAQSFDLTSDALYQDMQTLIRDYFDSPNDEEKKKRGEVIRKYAKDLKRVWEGKGIGVELSDKDKKHQFEKDSKKSFGYEYRKNVRQADRNSN